MRKLIDGGIEMKRQDDADPVRGPTARLARKVFEGYMEAELSGNNEGLVKEFETLRDSFSKQFTDPEEARRYRLYHYIIGSTPSGTSDLFDSEGEGSITEGINALAKKYHIDN